MIELMRVFARRPPPGQAHAQLAWALAEL